MRIVFKKYGKQIWIAFFAISIGISGVHAQNISDTIKLKPDSLTRKMNTYAGKQVKNEEQLYTNLKGSLQNGIQANPIKKTISDNGRKFLSDLSVKPASSKLEISQAVSEVMVLPKEISESAITQTKVAGKLEIGGIANQIYFSQQYNIYQNASFTDFSFKSDIESKYKKMAETLSSGYAAILNKTLQDELIQMKGLKDKIDKSINQNIDNVIRNASDLKKTMPELSLSEFNYESIIADKSNTGIEKLRAELKSRAVNDSSAKEKINKIESMLTAIQKSKQTYNMLNPDSTIAKYDELMKSEKQKLLTKPSALKNFIQSNKLQGFNFNFLMWAKKIDLGNFFSPGNIKSAIQDKAGSSFDLGNITSGIQVVLNNKNNVKLLLGDNITNKVDALWMPGSVNTYLNKYQSTSPQLFQRVNGELSIEDIKALGGISVGASQQTSTPNSFNSFFGFSRKFKNFTISKKILNTKMHRLTIDIGSSVTTYINNSSSSLKAQQLPDISTEQKSLNYAFSYAGMFEKLNMEASVLVNGNTSGGTSAIGSYDRPSFDVDVFMRKYFLTNKLGVTASFNSSMYSSGLNSSNLFSRNVLLNVRYNISKKNIIDVVFRGNKNASDAIINNSNYSFETGYNTSFKKKGLKYSILTKLTALHQSIMIYGLPKTTGGWVKGMSNTSSIMFPQNFSLQNTIDISINTFANNTFLTGNRVTVAPGVEFQYKKYRFSTGAVYEQVTSFYQQIGSRNGITVSSLFDKAVSLNASLDLRYNLKQNTPVFNNKWVSYGNIAIQYSLK